MAVSSVISETIDTADQEAQYDTCEKRFLSEKIILAWILKECVSKFEKYSVPQIMKDCIEDDSKVAVIAVDANTLKKGEDYVIMTDIFAE